MRPLRCVPLRPLLAGVLLTLALAAASCNTVKGVGEDIQGAADTTQRAIDNAAR
jgi:predicted small secreted protein